MRRSPAYSTARNISVTGEVNYEGSFTLESKELRLSDAINMAGGLTPDAYLKGARLTRQLTDEERIRHQASMAAIREILVDRGDSIVWAKIQQSNSYYVGIDLAGAMKKPGSDKDILLREGDQIFVPEYNGVVKISGDVMFPNTVFFDGKKGVNKYIEEAGGYGSRAKKSKTFIVYQNGTVGLTSKGAKPEPGCEIIVPAKKKRQSTFDVAALTATLTSVASLSTVAVSLTSLIVTLKK